VEVKRSSNLVGGAIDACARPRWCRSPRCGAFVDERRIVAGDEGGRVRTRSDHPTPRVVRRRHYALQLVERLQTRRGSPVDPAREAGARTLVEMPDAKCSFHGLSNRQHQPTFPPARTPSYRRA